MSRDAAVPIDPRLLPWLSELGGLVPELVRSHLPNRLVDARLRERVLVAVAEGNGCRSAAWVHAGWQRYLGDVDPRDADDAVLGWARRCAAAGVPLDPGPLADVLSPAGVRTVRATVARGALVSRVGLSAEALVERARGRRALWPGLARDLVAVGLGGPPMVPVAAVGIALGLAERLAPPPPSVELEDDEPNLLAHLLAEAVPAWIAGVLARVTVVRFPADVIVAVKAGQTTATVRIGRGRLSVANGVHPDAWVLIEGDGEPLLRAASGALGRELRSVRIRPT
ncbi:MAG: hypothetical protein JWN46_888 [Acidimicrobiales bacterium]|nr:hypothetical protein [Acidimicrobiales bacterium]